MSPRRRRRRTAGIGERAQAHMLVELADGTYVFQIPGVIPVNSGIVVGDDAVAVIDTGTTEADARALLHAVATVSDLPVRYVINTHHHGDHSFGNWWFLPAVVLGHERCRLRLLGDEGVSHQELIAAYLPMAAEQIAAVPLTPPTVTFADTIRVALGGRSLRLDYLGLAHTDNDIAVAVEDAGISFAGDLIEESGPPIVNDGYPNEWGPTLRRLEAMPDERFVPGHGRPVDRSFVASQAAAFELLARACGAAGDRAAAIATLPRDVLAVLGPQAPSAVERFFETTNAGELAQPKS